MPRFSIIMPTFRRKHVIFSTIETIQQQTLSDWELIVVDNAGSDYKFDDSRIRYFTYTETRGAGRARNFGIGKIMGELTCFFDDDDIMHPHFLQSFDRIFQNQDVMMAHCGMLTGMDRTTVNFSFATPEVVVRSRFVQPLWDSEECHDQRYFQLLASTNRWSGGQIVEIPEVLVTARTDPRGGLRDPEGKP